MATYDLRQFAGPEPLAHSAAADWLKEASKAGAQGGTFCAALSGGRIARNFFSSLAERASAQKLLPQAVHFFWSDERCVPPSDPESNFRPARELLFTPLNIPEDQIHRIRGEDPPEAAAAAAEAELRKFSAVPREQQPVLDLVLLGMGEDGHVASLFPGEPGNAAANPAVFRSVRAVKPPPMRITLGYAAIAAAKQVWVLASGKGKEAALRESLQPGGSTPLARVLSLRPLTRIYSDIQI